MYSRFFWAKLFVRLAFLWAMGMLGIIVVAMTIVFPAIEWIFGDGWHWMPMKKWIAGILSVLSVGPFAGGFYALHEWLLRVDNSLIKKIVVSVLVISSLIYLCLLVMPSLVHYSVDRFL